MTFLRRQQLERVCDDFESEWRAGQRPSIEEFLRQVEGDEQIDLFRTLVEIDAHYRSLQGETPSPLDYQSFGEFANVVEDVLANAARGNDATTDRNANVPRRDSIAVTPLPEN